MRFTRCGLLATVVAPSIKADETDFDFDHGELLQNMALDRLNCFVPYENAAAWHENQLTRALLVVLRYSPMAHQAWLGLIDQKLRLHSLPKAQFATQGRHVLSTDSEISEGEAVRGMRVWLAPDAAPVIAPIESSERQQVLDGVITYGSDLVVVIENKIGWVERDQHR